jgi:predicted nucleic acid-binding protein
MATSFLVRALTREPGWEAPVASLSRQPDASLIISDWVVTECAATLSVKLRTAAIDEPVRTAIADPFEMPRQQVLQTVPISSNHFHMAAHFARHTQLGPRAGDALHVAMAAEADAAIRTTDKRLASAATAVGVTVEIV